jgi:hypothetical protein
MSKDWKGAMGGWLFEATRIFWMTWDAVDAGERKFGGGSRISSILHTSASATLTYNHQALPEHRILRFDYFVVDHWKEFGHLILQVCRIFIST